ncbi:glycolipid transfer protein 3 [Cinnamomum micranthum f. kanehirae]|uniref:Glycolipid transfer protein 3 n=1 Tax=Cinnamomum micranthum f. kanehirae TaxID=337451 RepID=A0A3S3NIC5_9MAGN|nr:glycolipid transfer protein 3 [Cinnamomum micranthum f. kanehirae]
MKKNLLLMEKGSEIRSAIQELSLLKAEGLISTKPFLNVCNMVLQVLDKIGPTMAVLRQDVCQNIQRLEELYQMDPSIYANLADIVKKEVEEKSAKKALSCTRALLWLTRSLDFTVALLDKIARDPSQSLAKVVEISYDNTLKPWHGWISSAAYKVALKLVPDNKTFISILLAEEEECSMLKEEIQSLVSLLLPLLDEIHKIMEAFCLDSLKST